MPTSFFGNQWRWPGCGWVGNDKSSRTCTRAGNSATAQRIGVSTYSFFKFGGSKNTPVDRCIELAADMGFDGVEILHVQMGDDSVPVLNALKRRAITLGLDLMGLSTHQTFVPPTQPSAPRTSNTPPIASKSLISWAFPLSASTQVGGGRPKALMS